MEEKLLPLKDVISIVGFKQSTIYKFMRTRSFPKPVKIGRSSRWKLSEINSWVKQFS